MKKKLDADLTLSEIRTELANIQPRLGELKAMRDAFASMPPTRSELSERLESWLSRKTESGAEDLLSRLTNGGFLTGVDQNTDPGILFNGSGNTWKTGAVDASSLLMILSPVVAQFLATWVSAIPDEKLGTASRAESEKRIAAIDAERDTLLQRRDTLVRMLRETETLTAPPAAFVQGVNAGGRPSGAVDYETLYWKKA